MGLIRITGRHHLRDVVSLLALLLAALDPGAVPAAVTGLELTAAAAADAPASTGPFAGLSYFEPPGELDAPAPRDRGPTAERGARFERRRPSGAYPLYQWPLGRALGDGLVLVNYVDHDPTAAILDYEAGAHAYDGHTGTDYTLHNFRLMDEGCPVLSAASGTVAFVGSATPGAFDRSCSFDWPDDGNWVAVDNGDGTFAFYLHLRAWSLAVGVGESIEAGQLIGLVGSSGYSTGPHLHFETGDYFDGPYSWRDPYTGSANPEPSLWLAQEAYQGDDPLRFVDMGVYTDDAVGGSVFNTTYCDTQEGIHGPVVLGATEPHLNLWVQFQGNTGDAYRLEILRSDGSEWASFEDVLGFEARFDWFWAYWFWNGGVGPGDHGTWKARAFANGEFSREVTFEVAAETVYGPRFRPSGRSFRIDGSVQTHTLELTPLSPAATFALAGAPPEVTLVDDVLTVGATSSQPTRSAFFQVVATDTFGRSDTAWFHLVDMTKPLEPVTAVGEPPIDGRRLELSLSPNPARGLVDLEFRLTGDGPAAIALHDTAGRLIRRLTYTQLAAGWKRSSWDGRNASGSLVPSGVYFARLVSGRAMGAARVTVVR